MASYAGRGRRNASVVFTNAKKQANQSVTRASFITVVSKSIPSNKPRYFVKGSAMIIKSGPTVSPLAMRPPSMSTLSKPFALMAARWTKQPIANTMTATNKVYKSPRPHAIVGMTAACVGFTPRREGP